MKIEYICHACLVVDTGDVRIATDPWFDGSAYCNQWHVFPKPVNENSLSNVDVILVSHGHEDHLHKGSLQQLPRVASVLYPYTWFGVTTEFIKEMGFSNVTEARHLRSYHLTSDTSVTYLINRMDSIMVIESRDEVFVNLNDALHSTPPGIVNPIIAELKRRWPKIDTVFCAFGERSYFPNTIHCPGKHDVEIAEGREELFARNFCRIVKQLNPKVAVPFAADFALLNPRQRWINKVRFSRLQLPAYFKKLYPKSSTESQIVPMFSGDTLNGTELICKSPYRIQFQQDNYECLLEEQYRVELAMGAKRETISETDASILEREILRNLGLRASLFEVDLLGKTSFTVHVSDILEKPFFNISFRNGKPMVERSSTRGADSILQLQSDSRILSHSFASEWGGDALTIGCGCEVQVFDQETVTSNLDTVCMRLLTRHPAFLKTPEPLRWMRHLLARAASKREHGENPLNKITRETLFRPKCEVCRACDRLFSEQEALGITA